MTSQSKKVLRTVGFVVGLALLGAAIAAIVRSAPTLDQLRAVIARPDGWLIAWAVAATIGNLVGASGMFYALVGPFGRITFLEMGKLIAASSVLNYLPMRPGLVGRVVHQEVVNAIPMRRSVLSIVEAAVICAVTVLWLALAVAMIRFTSARAVGAMIAALPIFCGLAFLIPEHLLWRRFLQAIFWRWIDLLSWAVRYAVVFAMLGVELSPESAATAACISAAANMIPFLGNGLGVREWAIGLAGPVLATWTTDIGLAAELINRCLDLVVVVPLGIGVMPGIAKRIRTASKDKTAGDMPSKMGL
ncbi:MAG: hypothetical protein O2875_05330 [Planctomycetota bacterium]|nr:hypothetical protein [Planctomycetota bacterium]MDA1262965.1 hypothetical protein [Planctomycetota bacterium]